MRLRFPLAFVLTLWLSVAAPRCAAAHAVPVTSTPAPDAVLSEGPREVTVRFSERVEPRASALEVLNPRGDRIDDGHEAVAPDDPWLYRVALRPTVAGAYTVSWRVMSADDGHVTEGAYVFVVGEAAAPTPPATGRMTAVTGWLEPLARWIELTGVIALLGALMTPWVFRNRTPPRIPRALLILPWAGAIALGEGMSLLAKASQIGTAQGLSAGISALMATAVGQIGVGKVALTALLVGVFVVYWRAPDWRPWAWPLSTALTLLILMSHGLISHSAATVEWRGLALAAQMLHLLGMALWVGGLGSFATLFWWGGRRERSWARELVWAIPAFSFLASGAVGLLTLSGVYLARLHLGSFDALVSTAYGRMLLVKLGVAAVMGALGGYHQFVVHRRVLAALDQQDDQDARVSRHFRKTLRCEALLGLMTVLVAAFLGATSPPHSGASARTEVFRQEQRVDDALLVLEMWPLRPGLNTVRLTATDEHGQPLAGATAALLQLLPTHVGVGPVAVTLDQPSLGVFVKTGTFLGIEGPWRGRLTVQRQGAYDLNYRFEFVLQGPSRDHRREALTAPFDAVTGLVALGIIGVTGLLLRSSRRKLGRALQDLESTGTDPVNHPDGR